MRKNSSSTAKPLKFRSQSTSSVARFQRESAWVQSGKRLTVAFYWWILIDSLLQESSRMMTFPFYLRKKLSTIYASLSRYDVGLRNFDHSSRHTRRSKSLPSCRMYLELLQSLHAWV